ncbi:hypothetical protein ACFL4W_00695 [Planctomycetota bacterium]
MNWQFGSNDGVCGVCARSFEEEESFISNVTESEIGMARRDYCETCWEKVDQTDTFYYWKTVFRPVKNRNVFVDNETLMNFFIRLEEEDSNTKKNFRYLLSLILLRKRLLVFKDVFKEGDREYMIMRDKTDQEFRVLNPGMDKETIETVKGQMLAVLRENVFEGDDLLPPA